MRQPTPALPTRVASPLCEGLTSCWSGSTTSWLRMRSYTTKGAAPVKGRWPYTHM
jgi:hypothetical protein